MSLLVHVNIIVYLVSLDVDSRKMEIVEDTSFALKTILDLISDIGVKVETSSADIVDISTHHTLKS